jgi:hypothetical protein
MFYSLQCTKTGGSCNICVYLGPNSKRRITTQLSRLNAIVSRISCFRICKECLWLQVRSDQAESNHFPFSSWTLDRLVLLAYLHMVPLAPLENDVQHNTDKVICRTHHADFIHCITPFFLFIGLPPKLSNRGYTPHHLAYPGTPLRLVVDAMSLP